MFASSAILTLGIFLLLVTCYLLLVTCYLVSPSKKDFVPSQASFPISTAFPAPAEVEPAARCAAHLDLQPVRAALSFG